MVIYGYAFLIGILIWLYDLSDVFRIHLCDSESNSQK